MGERFRLSLHTQINELFFFSYQSLETGVCTIFFFKEDTYALNFVLVSLRDAYTMIKYPSMITTAHSFKLTFYLNLSVSG